MGKEGRDPDLERDAAAATGTLTHEMNEDYTLGRDPLLRLVGVEQERIDQAMRAHQAFRSWYDMSGLTVLDTELSLVSERYRFGGTMDAVARREDGALVLIDYKTSKSLRVDAIYQCAAYAWLYEEVNGTALKHALVARFGKHEDDDFETHEIDELTLRKAFDGFLGLLDIYIFDRELKKTMKGHK